MPITRSARKALRVSGRRTDENRQVKQKIRQTLKNASEKNIAEVFSVLDKAAKRDVIHPNKAARLKSRLSKKLSGLEATEKVAAKSATKKSGTASKKTAKRTTRKTKVRTKKAK